MTEFLPDGENHVSPDGDVLPNTDLTLPDAETGRRVAQKNNGLDCAVAIAGVSLGGNVVSAAQTANVIRPKTPRELYDEKVEKLVDQGVGSYDDARRMAGPEPDEASDSSDKKHGSLEALRSNVLGIRQNHFLSAEEKTREENLLISLYRIQQEKLHQHDAEPYVFVRPEF